MSFPTHQDLDKPGACWKLSRNTGASTLLRRRPGFSSRLGRNGSRLSELRFVSAPNRAHRNDLNSRIARKQPQKIPAARTVVFELFLQLAIKVDGSCWKSISAFGYYSNLKWGSVPIPHPVHTIMDKCLLNASPQALRILVRRVKLPCLLGRSTAGC